MAYFMRKYAFWAINGRDQSSGVICGRELEYKKRTQKIMENALPTQTPSRCPTLTKFSMWSCILDIFLPFKFH